MRVLRIGIILACTILLTSCDGNRVYETNTDFENRYWLAADNPEFEFSIDSSGWTYNLYGNFRNEVSYPKANLYFTYFLIDSTGAELQQKLMSEFLFDKKTGEPFGTSGLGDIYDHQFLLLQNYSFKHPGRYKVRFEQFMRMDTLAGVLAVGLRVERAPKEEVDK